MRKVGRKSIYNTETLEERKARLALYARSRYDPEKERKRKQEEYWVDPEKERKRKRTHFHRYGITRVDYDRMFAEQKGECAICGIHQSQLNRKLSVDHDHETGEVRGLLCPYCNHLLGNACDEVDTLKGAINYLKERGK